MDYVICGEEEREENDADAEGGSDDTCRELTSRGNGCFPTGHTFIETVYVAIDHDNGVINYHTQRHYEGGEGDGVYLYSRHIEDGNGDEDGDRDSGDGYACYPHRQHKHSDNDDRGNGYEQFGEELLY